MVARVAPHATLTIRLGAEVPGSPTDLRFDANTEPSVAIPAILEALGRRELTRRR